MNILALDLGTTTGYALYNDGPIVHGVWHFKNKTGEGAGMRLVRCRRQLDCVAKRFPKIDLVAYELVRRHIGTQAAHVYGALQGVVMEWCETHGFPYEGVPVGTIKKFATEKGNASKADMIAAVNRWGYKIDDDNQADALAILHMKTAELDLSV